MRKLQDWETSATKERVQSKCKIESYSIESHFQERSKNRLLTPREAENQYVADAGVHLLKQLCAVLNIRQSP